MTSGNVPQSHPLAGFTITTIPAADVLVLDLHASGRLWYSKPSDEWMDLSEELPDELQDAATRLFEAGLLPEFQESTGD